MAEIYMSLHYLIKNAFSDSDIKRVLLWLFLLVMCFGFIGGTPATYAATASASWTTIPQDAPAGVADGGNLAYPKSGDTIYALRGDRKNDFWTYTISTDSWDTAVANAPGPLGPRGIHGLPENWRHYLCVCR